MKITEAVISTVSDTDIVRVKQRGPDRKGAIAPSNEDRDLLLIAGHASNIIVVLCNVVNGLRQGWLDCGGASWLAWAK